MKHNFHFVLNKGLKDSISKFSLTRNMKLSETVVYIFNLMKPVLEKYYLKDVKCKSPGYSFFGADTDMHIYFEKTDYKYLRQIQSNLYCYSMVKILRLMLNVFFEGVSRYGFCRFCVVVGRYGKIHLKIKRDWSGKTSQKHMFYSIHSFQQILHIFDSEYNLISTKFT